MLDDRLQAELVLQRAVDEEATLLDPIHVRAGLALVVLVGLGLRVALFGEAGVEESAAGLPELDPGVVQHQVQPLRRQPVVLGDLRDGQQRA